MTATPGTPRQKALALIEQAGAEWTEDGTSGLQGAAYTPAGTVWKATGCHTLVVSYYTGRPAGWRSLLKDLERGTEPCDDVEGAECEICGGGWIETPEGAPR